MVHHIDALLDEAVVEVVGKGIGSICQRLLYKERLIVLQRNALMQNIVVSLVFMNITETMPQQIGNRTPPLYCFHKRQKQDVHRVTVENMGFLMQQNLTSKRLVVTFADDNATHPTKRCHIVDMTIDCRFSVFVSPQTTASNDLTNLKQLPKADKKRQDNTYYVYDSQNA